MIERAGTMGAHGSKGHSIFHPPTGALKVIVGKWKGDILDKMKLWHFKGGFPLTGTLSVTLLDEVRERLTAHEGTKKDKVDWVKFWKWEREADRRTQRQDHTTSIGPTNQCSRILANQAVCIVSHHPPIPLLRYYYSLFIIYA